MLLPYLCISKRPKYDKAEKVNSFNQQENRFAKVDQAFPMGSNYLCTCMIHSSITAKTSWGVAELHA